MTAVVLGTRPLFGVFVGGSSGPTGEIATYNAWLGQPADMASVHSGQANGEGDYVSSVGYADWVIQYAGEICHSLPLFWNEATLAGAGAGTYDADWTNCGGQILTKLAAQKRIILRTGWEQNATWMPWASPGKDALFIQAFRRFVGIMRGLDKLNQFKFVWCPYTAMSDPGTADYDPTTSYPGDDVVDVIGLDFYPHSSWGATAAAKWAFGKPMLDQVVTFARSHGKPWSLPEWAIAADIDGPICTNVIEYCSTAGDCLYANYFDSQAAGNNSISNGQYPNAAAAFKTAMLAAMAAPAVTASAPVAPPAPVAPAAAPVVAAATPTVTVGADPVSGIITLTFSVDMTLKAGVPLTLGVFQPLTVLLAADDYVAPADSATDPTGGALANILVNGVTVMTGVLVTAINGQSTQTVVVGNFMPGTYAVAVAFTNDQYGGSTTKDRNLYVKGADFGATTLPLSLTLDSNGTANFSITG